MCLGSATRYCLSDKHKPRITGFLRKDCSPNRRMSFMKIICIFATLMGHGTEAFGLLHNFYRLADLNIPIPVRPVIVHTSLISFFAQPLLFFSTTTVSPMGASGHRFISCFMLFSRLFLLPLSRRIFYSETLVIGMNFVTFRSVTFGIAVSCISDVSLSISNYARIVLYETYV